MMFHIFISVFYFIKLVVFLFSDVMKIAKVIFWLAQLQVVARVRVYRYLLKEKNSFK